MIKTGSSHVLSLSPPQHPRSYFNSRKKALSFPIANQNSKIVVLPLGLAPFDTFANWLLKDWLFYKAIYYGYQRCFLYLLLNNQEVTLTYNTIFWNLIVFLSTVCFSMKKSRKMNNNNYFLHLKVFPRKFIFGLLLWTR